jgi:integrase/recombinase XerC
MISKWLNNLALTTAEAYRKDLRTFAEFTGHVDAEACAQAFIRLDNGQANALLLAWKSSMRDAGKSPATINRRLSTLKSLVKRARLLGLTTMCVDVAGERRSAYRDTRGPSMAAIRKILAEAEKRIDAKGLRDLSLLVLMTDLGLRRGEMVSLDREHVDLPGSRLAVMGKGRRELEWVTMPSQTQEALAAWLVLRGDHPGALFHNFDRAKKSTPDGRLTGAAVYAMVRRISSAIGHPTRPHGFRHSAIVEAMISTNGNHDTVAKFSRHVSLRGVDTYDARMMFVANPADLAQHLANTTREATE